MPKDKSKAYPDVAAYALGEVGPMDETLPALREALKVKIWSRSSSASAHHNFLGWNGRVRWCGRGRSNRTLRRHGRS